MLWTPITAVEVAVDPNYVVQIHEKSEAAPSPLVIIYEVAAKKKRNKRSVLHGEVVVHRSPRLNKA